MHTVTLNPVVDLIYRIDRFEKGTTFRCGEFLQVPAGKGINVSYILSCFGIPSAAHAILGGDEAQHYQSTLESRSITAAITIAPVQTRHHCTLLEQSTQSVTHAQIQSQPVPAECLQQLENGLFQSLNKGDIAVFSGSLPTGAETGLYAKWILKCRDLGILPLLDSSGDALRQGVTASPWMLKSNEHEAEELMGNSIHNEKDIMHAAQWIQTQYQIPYIILSLGSRGLAAIGENKYYRLRVNMDAEKIIDSVGCGDAVAGGFLYAWLHQKNEDELFAYAIATATAAAIVLGPGTIKPSDVEELLKQVECEIHPL